MTYRHSNFEGCFLCGERATLRCPRCGRPFCAAHGIFGDKTRCADCEASFARKKDTRNFVSAIAGIATGVGVAAAFLSAGAVSMIWVPFTVLCGALGGALVGGPWHAISRGRFLREGNGERVIAGALKISPHGGQMAETRRLMLDWKPRQRGMPSVPIYQRTYGH